MGSYTNIHLINSCFHAVSGILESRPSIKKISIGPIMSGLLNLENKPHTINSLNKAFANHGLILIAEDDQMLHVETQEFTEQRV